MFKNSTHQIESLASLKRTDFRALWAEHFGQPLKIPARRELLVCCLAYRIQEKTRGGLSVSTRKKLSKLAEEIDANPDAGLRDFPCIKPGTRLIREWRGEIHTVTTIEKGFSYAGKHYKSLSEIARLITGTRWSGPRFFGLEASRNPTREHSHAR